MDRSKILPNAINDLSMRSLDQCSARMEELDLVPLLVCLIDEVDSSVLPFLAEQFHVLGYEGWNLAVTEKQKRELIKSSILLHRKKGTKYAIETVLNSLDILTKVTEWFEYDGDPYLFKVKAKMIDRGYSFDVYEQILGVVNNYKNKRSHIEEIEISTLIPCNVPKIGIAIKMGCHMKVMTDFNRHYKQIISPKMGIAVRIGGYVKVYIT